MVRLSEETRGITSSETFYPLNNMDLCMLDTDINRKLMESKYGFRLQELNRNADACSNKDLCEDATSVSGHSHYKQKIDSMFDDSRSQVSEKSREWIANDGLKSLMDEYRDEPEKRVKNNIQEKIEKMFEEISLNGFETSSTYKKVGGTDRKSKNLSSHDFRVTYLGCKTLDDKSVSLMTLQEPLKDLYLEHKKGRTNGVGNFLTISREGLKIKIDNNETLNPFPTIAVWASVKFSFRKFKNGIQFAFLPLIKDPDGIDKNVLYRELPKEEEMFIIERSDGDKSTPPIFSVVMKNSQLKVLECHAFICISSEEAIVIAANLYQALMKKMNNKGFAGETETEGNITSSESEREVAEVKPTAQIIQKPHYTPPPVPSRPPRKQSKESLDVLELETKQKTVTADAQFPLQRRRGSAPVSGISSNAIVNVKRSLSDRRNNVVVESIEGDILTKVAIPRSRSFLNANGPLTRYSRRYKMSAHSDGEVSSPLGFNELFHEFRQNEGLESMDDILNAIIDAEGMSFNDLKPIYKEFLLKLAVTLTKDELFQRSKNIMRKQKKKSRNRSLRRKNLVSATGLRKVFRKTASKLSKPKNSRPTTLEFTSVVFQSGNKHFETSTSSNCSTLVKKKDIRRRPSSRRKSKKQDRKQSRMANTSDESDSFTRRNGNESGGCPNRSSSGYFSCSECSYDSENCTCTSADKCYCTLGTRKVLEKDKISVTSCGCDTESCANSEKCYCNDQRSGETNDKKAICQTPHFHQNKQHDLNCPNYAKVEKCKKHNPTIFEQLKEQGFAASDSSLSRAASPSTAWRNNEEKVMNPKECLRASRSLEFLQIRPKKSTSRQQIHECPSPPPISSESKNYVEGTRHFCYHGDEKLMTRKLGKEHELERQRQQKLARQFSSMRARPSHVDVQCSRFRGRVFNSMRARSVHEDIMSHVLFPERNGSTSSSLRFVRRMDVYNSFDGRKCVERQGSYMDLLNQLQNRFVNDSVSRSEMSKVHSISEICHHDSLLCLSSESDLKKIDYDLFTATAKSETSETNSNDSERKVLVVSARDPKGKVLYMGASSRGEHIKHVLNDQNAVNASEALSVKKSAEIAALFSDVATKQKSRPTSMRSSASTNISHRRLGSGYRLNNIENTLGYLP